MRLNTENDLQAQILFSTMDSAMFLRSPKGLASKTHPKG